MFGVGPIHICMTCITYMPSHKLYIKKIIPRMKFIIVYVVVFMYNGLSWYIILSPLKVNVCRYQILHFCVLLCRCMYLTLGFTVFYFCMLLSYGSQILINRLDSYNVLKSQVRNYNIHMMKERLFWSFYYFFSVSCFILPSYLHVSICDVKM